MPQKKQLLMTRVLLTNSILDYRENAELKLHCTHLVNSIKYKDKQLVCVCASSGYTYFALLTPARPSHVASEPLWPTLSLLQLHKLIKIAFQWKHFFLQFGTILFLRTRLRCVGFSQASHSIIHFVGQQ